MVRAKDSVMADLKRVRREISARLAKARAAGRELDELRAIEREGDVACRQALKGGRNGHARKRKQ